MKYSHSTGKGHLGGTDHAGRPWEGSRSKATNVSPGQGCKKQRAPSGKLWGQDSSKYGKLCWKKKKLIPTHIHNKKLEVCVTARKPGWILEKKPCPSKDADAQEELAQELMSPHPQQDHLDKCQQEQLGHAQSSSKRGRCSDSLRSFQPYFYRISTLHSSCPAISRKRHPTADAALQQPPQVAQAIFILVHCSGKL